MKYERICAEVFGKPWAILPEKLNVITELLALRASGRILTEEEIHHLGYGAAAMPSPRAAGGVAVIPIYGVISNRMNLLSSFSGGTSVEKLTASFRAALADPGVKGIVFDVDSPGGSVDGVPELAAEIYDSRKQKKSIAVVNTQAASAAYWLASAADELVATPSGGLGSIGVFATHEDKSKAVEGSGVKMTLVSAGKFKMDGNPYEPLSDAARADLQTKVDAFYEMFVKAVAKNRAVSADSVRNGFGEGRMVMAAPAVKEGMADRVETLDQTLARFGVSRQPTAQRVAAQAPSLAALERELSLHL